MFIIWLLSLYSSRFLIAKVFAYSIFMKNEILGMAKIEPYFLVVTYTSTFVSNY